MKFIKKNDSRFSFATNSCERKTKRENWWEKSENFDADSATDGCTQNAPRSRKLSEISVDSGKKPFKSIPKTVRKESLDNEDGGFSEDLDEKNPPRREKEKKEGNGATSAALRILQSGANSRKMLREKLARKGFSKSEIEIALDEVASNGLLNDRRLLESYAEALARRKHYGKYRIRMELYQKFDREVVEAYFDEAVEEIDFAAYATALALKEKNKSEEALVAKLRRNGYQASEIREALTALKEENEEEE